MSTGAGSQGKTELNGNSKMGTPDVEAIMRRIREDVRLTIKNERAEFPKYIPPAPEDNRNPGTALIDFEELNYINSHWHNWCVTEELNSHRKYFGKLVVKAKRFIIGIVWQYILKGYLEREQQFNMQLVRYLNANARHVDNRDYENFWQLIRKMDNDVAALNDRMDRLIDVLDSRISSLELQADTSVSPKS